MRNKKPILAIALLGIGAPTMAAVMYTSMADESDAPTELVEWGVLEEQAEEKEEIPQAPVDDDYVDEEYEAWASESSPDRHGYDYIYQSAKNDARDAAQDARDVQRDITGSDPASNAARSAAKAAELAVERAERSLDGY